MKAAYRNLEFLRAMSILKLFILVLQVLALRPNIVASQEYESITYYIKSHPNTTCSQGLCMTLSEFATQSRVVEYGDVTLRFSTGIHLLDRQVNVQSFTAGIYMYRYSMTGNPNALPELKSAITCSGSSEGVGFSFSNIPKLEIKYLSFFSCGYEGNPVDSIIKVDNSNLRMDSTSFQHNVVASSTIILNHSNMSASDCFFTDNVGITGGGVALSVSNSSIARFRGSTAFVRNKCIGHGSGGAISLHGSILYMVSSEGQPAYYTEFSNQSTSMQVFSGAIYFIYNSVQISESIRGDGGGIYAFDSAIVIQGKGTFRNNRAFSGGAISIYYSKLGLNGEIEFINNFGASTGGALEILSSLFSCRGNSIYKGNEAHYLGGAVTFRESDAILVGEYTVENSIAEQGAVFGVLNSYIRVNGSILSYNNTSTYGILKILRSELRIYGTLNLTENKHGLHAFMSKVYITGNFIASRNRGNDPNVGVISSCIHLQNATMSIADMSSIEDNIGTPFILLQSILTLTGIATITGNADEQISGGMYLVNSTVIFKSLQINTSRNSGKNGGAFFLSEDSTLLFSDSVEFNMSGNTAERGGEIFVKDVVTFQYCDPKTTFFVQYGVKRQCFFQIYGNDMLNKHMIFADNTASLGGNDLYGGLLDICESGFQNSTKSGISIFLAMSNFTKNRKSNSSSISSDPFTVCFCENQSLRCDQKVAIFHVRRGEEFSVSLAAAGQANGIVPAVVRAQFNQIDILDTALAPNQAIQQSGQHCQPFNYTVFSAKDYVELSLYADGPCRDLGNSSRTVQVHLLDCPIGLQLAFGRCICHPQIQHLTDTCLSGSGEIKRSTNWWIGVQYFNRSFEGFITYPHCPFDYCRKEEMFISLEYPDSQCALNRSGILCGACQHGLSLTLGGSECDKCDSAITTPIVLLVALIAGVVLVITLLVLRLNVAIGTINGLVFYANIVSVNKAVFFPAGDSNILTVFTAWLNFDLGIKICFYNGLDMYMKAWLQFLFPLYIWLLIAIIVVCCHYSTKISRLFGRNPVACLSTLILLSYTKILQNIITVLAFTTIEYPDNRRHAVWLQDANIRYLSGKHIPLFAVALCALVFLFIPYTVFLTTGPWIQTKINSGFIRKLNRYLNPFFDAYYAPFKPHHRYWPGALLILRCILLLIFSLNKYGNIGLNLLAITVVIVVIFILRQLTGHLYRSRALEILEISFLLNLFLLSAFTYHVTLSDGNKGALIYSSVGFAFTQFSGIVLYHIYIQTKGYKLCIKLKKMFHSKTRGQERTIAGDSDEASLESYRCEQNVNTTELYIDLRESLLEDRI